MKHELMLRGAGLLVLLTHVVSCADMEQSDPATPAPEPKKSMSERFYGNAEEKEGFKQDSEGNWVPRSDKRSMFESKRDSGISKEEFQKKAFKTGEYAKTNWWGSKSHETGSYGGVTEASGYGTKARQNGQEFRDGQKAADRKSPYATNQLDRKTAYEEGKSGVDKPGNAYLESKRDTYKAPSVIDWKEQREISERSKGILGR